MAGTEEPIVTFKKRSGKANARKPVPARRPPSPSDDDSSASERDEDGRIVKRRKTTGKLVNSSSTDQKADRGLEGTTQFAADRSATIDTTNDATRQSDWYEEVHSAKNGAAKPPSKDWDTGNSALSSKAQSFISKKPDAPKTVGPVKAPTNVRTITVTDYAPDVCKDYKQTGFCGFGDSCKFLHAREEFAAGWKLDRDWEISTKGKKLTGTTVASANRDAKLDGDDLNEEEIAMLEKIPFACIICKEPYKNPIVTKCGHYFCESCALKRYRKKPDCAACGAGTGGVFNGAKGLQKILDKKREREKKIKEREEAEAAAEAT